MKKLSLTLLLFPALAFAQEDWEYVGSASDKSTYYIKNVEKKSYGDLVLFWNKTVLPDKYVKTKKGNVVKKGGYTMIKYEGDCSDETLKTLMIALYDSNGNIKNSNSGPYISEPVIPDSMGKALLSNACDKFRE